MQVADKGRRTLAVARPLWAQAQAKVLRELGAQTWAGSQRRLARLFHIAVTKAVMESCIPGRLGRMAPLVLAVSLSIAPGVAAGGSDEAWAALAEGGHVALIRHGNTPPGYGDPPGFKIDDCRTQRNLMVARACNHDIKGVQLRGRFGLGPLRRLPRR